jgi:hypothetical protein
MSLSRSAYDEGAYRHSLRESLGPAEYIFQSAPTNKYACDPAVKEAESSELLGIDRKNSRCPSDYFLPGPDNVGACPTPTQLGYTPDFIRDEHTKVSNPPSTLRGKGVNRFKVLHENPQDKAISPFHFRIQDNLNARDNHRVNIPKPVDAKQSLPIPSGDLPVERYTFIPTPTIPVILPLTKDELNF